MWNVNSVISESLELHSCPFSMRTTHDRLGFEPAEKKVVFVTSRCLSQLLGQFLLKAALALLVLLVLSLTLKAADHPVSCDSPASCTEEVLGDFLGGVLLPVFWQSAAVLTMTLAHGQEESLQN
jgi:hypothetical protein